MIAVQQIRAKYKNTYIHAVRDVRNTLGHPDLQGKWK
jgi:hypothetical protein